MDFSAENFPITMDIKILQIKIYTMKNTKADQKYARLNRWW